MYLKYFLYSSTKKLMAGGIPKRKFVFVVDDNKKKKKKKQNPCKKNWRLGIFFLLNLNEKIFWKEQRHGMELRNKIIINGIYFRIEIVKKLFGLRRIKSNKIFNCIVSQLKPKWK